MEGVNLPLVSVIIPTYNRMRTLPESVDSVLRQTYRHLELIIVDDGSEDGTEEYVKGIDDNRVRYEKREANKGPSAARNLGAQLAAGEYLAFQDSDDEWMSDKLEKQMELLLRDEELALVYCEFGIYQDENLLMRIPSRQLSYEYKCGDMFSYLLLYPLISTQTMIVRREAFLRENGFNETLKAYEDFEFTLRFSQKYTIGFVEDTLVKVYSSPGSVNQRFAEIIHTQFFMAREMLEPLRERDLLWEKIKIISQEAEQRLCHDTFIEELAAFSRECLAEAEQRDAQLFLQKMERSKDIFFMKLDILKSLPILKTGILKIYAKVMEDKSSWSEAQREEVENLLNFMTDCENLVEIPADMREQYNQIRRKCKMDSMKWTEQLFLLTDLVGLLETLERLIGNSLH